jgi:Xaa-Pro dipeptidase
VLFVPFLSEAYRLWMHVKPLEKFRSDYDVDEVKLTDDLRKHLEEAKPSTIYLFAGTDSDSGLTVDEPSQDLLEGFEVNREVLWPLICNLRAVKTPEEIELIRYVCKVGSEAECIAARSAKPGLLQNQLHTVFQFQHSIKSGGLHLGFCSIASSGCDCATLHYIENDKVIQPNQMVLLDMGGKWHGYVADQAMTFPVSGKFDPKQRKIYTAVLEAQKAVKAQLKPGVQWDEMHLLAEKVILEHLIEIGVVNKFPMEELVEHRIGAIFFPHGLGHLLGLRVHDLGGYTEGPARSEKEGLNKLRTRRVLEEGIVITVEPGCYFIDFKIEKTLNDPVKAKYLNKEKIEEYKEVGGVRLEDDVVITKDGYECLTLIPREIEDVEKLLTSK